MNQHVLLIAAAHPGDDAMHADLVAMRAVLQRRGYGKDEILCLAGQ